MVQYFSKYMDGRDTVKFYSIKIYGLQMNSTNMPRNFYGYLKARENVIAPVSHPWQLPETKPLHFNFQLRN